MSAALQMAKAVLEGEDPKDFLRRMSAAQTKQLEVGEEVCHSTGIVKDHIEACLYRLQQLDPVEGQEQMSDEVRAYLRGANPEDWVNFDPDYYGFEVLPSVMQKYCPPFSYFGGNEGDGSLGCWPIGHDGIEEAVDRDELTFVDARDDNERYTAIAGGDFSSIQTPYVLLEKATGGKVLYTKAGRKVWEW